MNAETIMLIVILALTTLPFLVIGIVQIRSSRPVGFWTGEIPPDVSHVTDVAAYNKKHGIMWVIYGAGILPSYFIGHLFGGGGGAAIGATAEICGGIIVMIFYHIYLYKKYVIPT